MTKNEKLLAWVKEVEALCQPDSVRWCDGSQEEYDEMIQAMVGRRETEPTFGQRPLPGRRVAPQPSQTAVDRSQRAQTGEWSVARRALAGSGLVDQNDIVSIALQVERG